MPDFATEMTASNENKEQEEQERKKEALCKEVFEVCTKHFLPQIGGPRSMDSNIFRPFSLCHNTWQEGAVFLRHDLIESAKDWNYLGFSGSSPYPEPTAEEKAKHKSEYENFKDVRSLKDQMATLFRAGNDGWVFLEVYDTAMEVQKDMYRELVKTALNPKNQEPDDAVKDEEDVRAWWPYDV